MWITTIGWVRTDIINSIQVIFGIINSIQVIFGLRVIIQKDT